MRCVVTNINYFLLGRVWGAVFAFLPVDFIVAKEKKSELTNADTLFSTVLLYSHIVVTEELSSGQHSTGQSRQKYCSILQSKENIVHKYAADKHENIFALGYHVGM